LHSRDLGDSIWSFILTKFYSENIKGKDHLEDLDIDGRIILKLMLEEVEYENERSDSTKGGRFFFPAERL
jgi:hypothetical protein